MESHFHDAILYSSNVVFNIAVEQSDRDADNDVLSVADLQLAQQKLVNMDVSALEQRIMNHTRGTSKSMLSQRYMKGMFQHVQNPIGLNDIRHTPDPQLAFSAHVYAGKSGSLLIMDNVLMKPAPETAIQDRHYLSMTIEEYKKFAEAVSTYCYINKDGQLCKLKNAKTKKLKNLRHTIRKNKIFMTSLIWKEQLRLIELELGKRQHVPNLRRPEQ